MYKLNLVELNPSSAALQGTEFAVENKENGCVYITTKPYIDKMFKLMGYRNLRVIQILKEFADKTVSDVGDLKENKIYIDDTTQSFIVAHPDTVKWVNDLLTFFADNEFKVESRKADTCYNWDQLLVKTPAGNYYAIYVDLCDDYVQVIALDYDGKVLSGIINEGSYSTLEGDDSLNSLIVLMTNPIDISPEFTPNQKLSIYEYVNLLKDLGYVRTKRGSGKAFKTDEAEEVIGYIGNLDDIIDEYNASSWLQQRIKESPNHATFADGCVLISMNLGDNTFWKFVGYYMNNAREQSDFFALNY